MVIKKNNVQSLRTINEVIMTLKTYEFGGKNCKSAIVKIYNSASNFDIDETNKIVSTKYFIILILVS
jgi:hypothetical protein